LLPFATTVTRCGGILLSRLDNKKATEDGALLRASVALPVVFQPVPSYAKVSTLLTIAYCGAIILRLIAKGTGLWPRPNHTTL